MMHIEAGTFIQGLGMFQHVPTTGFVHMQANGLWQIGHCVVSGCKRRPPAAFRASRTHRDMSWIKFSCLAPGSIAEALRQYFGNAASF